MITIHVTAGTPKDRAAATVDGQAFEARSGSGAIFALCRALVAAGIPDQPWQSINTAAPGMVSMTGPSIHRAAGLTVAQPDDRPPHFRRWTPQPERAAGGVSEGSPMRADPDGAGNVGGDPARAPVAPSSLRLPEPVA